MSVRETINKHPKITACIGGAATLILFIKIGMQAHLEHYGPTVQTRAFYSDDDGASTFVDDFVKVCPFDHNARPAYRAFVFSGPDGKPFVGYLERFTPEGQRELAKVAQSSTYHDALDQITEREGEVKIPNDAKADWAPVSSSEGNRIVTLQYRASTLPLTPVVP